MIGKFPDFFQQINGNKTVGLIIILNLFSFKHSQKKRYLEELKGKNKGEAEKRGSPKMESSVAKLKFNASPNFPKIRIRNHHNLVTLQLNHFLALPLAPSD